MGELATTPLRALGAPADEDGCRVLSATPWQYLDGAEERLFDIIQRAEDLSSTSDELAGSAQTWPERYHLSHDRANVLRPLDLQPGFKVLEVGAECGAITRYLGEMCDLVDAVEPVSARARVARTRTRDLPGVEVFVGDLFDVPGDNVYDIIVLVGVLEYVGSGSAELAPYQKFLHRAASLLTPDGSLLVAIENRIGVKYLAGAPEDHSNRPFDSLEGYPNGSLARTFSRGELEELIRQTRLTPRVFGAFPDYKLTRIVMSEELLETDPSLAYRIPHFPSPDWGGDVDRVANEGAVWRTMIEAGLGPETANSFVILASRRQPGTLWPEDQLAAYYSTARRAGYASETRVLSQDGTIVFARRALSGDVAVQGDADPRVQLRLERTPWTEGTDFLVLLSRANDKELIDWLGRWTDLLSQEFEPGQPTPIDLLPHNLVALPDGRLQAIDSKFVQNGIPREAVVARGALVTGLRLSRLTKPSRWGAFTVEEVVRYIGTLIGLPADGSWIADAVAGEAAFQAEVSLHTPEPATRAEAVALQEAVLWEELHLPLALSSQYNPGVGARIALEAELSRMGAAYGRLVDSHDGLVSAHHTAVDGHAQQMAMLLGQLGTTQADLTKTRISLDAHVAEFARIKASSSWKFTRPLRAVSRWFRRTPD
ncbi:MAG TPA: class I SAM-dependent methyltransferase [Acidimicrobiales bacterium]|nr:class I SAM-dependent methyltransferase [Acidimicrobiales bacterium]